MFNRKHLISELTTQSLRALTVILICGSVIFFVSEQIINIGKTLEEKRTGAAVLENRGKSIEKLKHDLEIVGNGDELINNALIKMDNIAEFINVMENLAAGNNVKQTLKFPSPPVKFDARSEKENTKSAKNTKNAQPEVKIEPPEIKNGIDIYVISYNMNLTANIYDLIAYMEAFEKLPYFTEISSMTINAISNNWESDSSVSITAKLYAKQ